MLDAILRPRSVAVIGASRKPNTIGYQILENLVTHGFAGAVYPVNPTADAVHSIRAYPSVEAIADEVDLAVIVVPKQHVCDAAEACGRKGVKGLVVISAGFAEVGGSGTERQKRLTEIVRRYGMRLVGPNCMGVLNTAPDRSMNATFAPTMPPPGPVAFMSQSGAMGVTILDYAAEYGIGISQFVSVGNKPDVSGNDLIQYWADDERTGVILMYLENFGNPRKFTQLAREITRRKPVIAVKSGRSVAGARAASSHTGALAGTDAATDALLRQCGVLRADTVEEMFDLAMAFSHQPIPRGNRVAIVTNAGGPGIIIADACEAHGLVVTELAEETRALLAKHFPEEASLTNPVDMIASATPQSYRIAVEAVLADPNVDAVIATFVPPLGVRQEDVAEAIVSVAAGQTEKPVVAVLMGRQGLPQGLAELNAAGIPGYRFPESGVRALAAMYRYRRWLERPAGEVRAFAADREAVAGIIAAARAEGREKLSETEVMRVLEAYGIPVAPYSVARTADEAAEAAARIGWPVVAKVLSPRIIHKSDVGGVVVGIEDEAELRAAFHRLTAEVPARAGIDPGEVDGVLVQKMVGGGKETIVGMTLDPQFGPVLMFGLGGIYVEALKDVVFRVQPVTDVDAREMVRAIRGAALLQGVRGEPASDVAAVEETIQRISQLVGDHPEIREMDVNPWMAFAEGGVAVDGRIAVGWARARTAATLQLPGAIRPALVADPPNQKHMAADRGDVRLIHRVLIRNYKSIAACDVSLGPLTFLVGANGSGKSNFLDALRFVADSLRTSLDHALRDRGGLNEVRRRSSGHPRHFGIRLEFHLPGGARGHYAFDIGALKNAFTVQHEECFVTHPAGPEAGTHFYQVNSGTVMRSNLALAPAAIHDRLYLVNVSGTPAFRPVYDALSRMGFYNLNPNVIRDLQPPDPGEILARDGENLPSVLASLAAANEPLKKRIEEYLAQVVPGVSGVDSKPIGPRETLEFRQQIAGAEHPWRFIAANMSDGTLRALGVLVALFQGGTDSATTPLLIGIEEPETALHPAAAEVLIDGLHDASELRQVLVTSHSPDLLDSPRVSETEILAVLAEEGESKIGSLDEAGRSVLREHLYTAGDLMRMSQLRPNPAALGLKPDQLPLFGAHKETVAT